MNNEAIYGQDVGGRGSPEMKAAMAAKKIERAARRAAKEEHQRGVEARRLAREERRRNEATQRGENALAAARRFHNRVALAILKVCENELGRPRCVGVFRDTVIQTHAGASRALAAKVT